MRQDGKAGTRLQVDHQGAHAPAPSAVPHEDQTRPATVTHLEVQPQGYLVLTSTVKRVYSKEVKSS